MPTAAPINNSNPNRLQVQKSATEYRQQVEQLCGCAWQVAYTALWNSLEFSPQEIQNAKNFISSFLQQGTSHMARYREFVQRVVLARMYLNSHPGKYIPLPSQWFSIHNKNGFAGTQQWYNAVEQTRAAMPLYRQAVKAFPEAVLETIQTGKAADFHYWRSFFSRQNANMLLNLYLSTMANHCLSRP